MLNYKNKGVLFSPLCAMLIWACVSKLPETKEIIHDNWVIHPKSGALKKQAQFVISGKNLFAAELITGESVTVGQKSVSPNGRTLKVYLTFYPLKTDSSGKPNDPLDDLGSRIIQVRTLESLEELVILIPNETVEPELSK